MKPLYFKDGTLFANDYIRVVYGKRGKYIELTKDQIATELIPKFNTMIFKGIEPYYIWLLPKGRDEKIYWQKKTVKYADYKIGLYYVSPDLLQPIPKPKQLGIWASSIVPREPINKY